MELGTEYWALITEWMQLEEVLSKNTPRESGVVRAKVSVQAERVPTC